MMSKQPEALRIADELDDAWHHGVGGQEVLRAADELRRLHEENEYLVKTAANLLDQRDARIAELKAANAELLKSLQSISECCDEDRAARDYASRQTEIRGIARYAIAKHGGH